MISDVINFVTSARNAIVAIGGNEEHLANATGAASHIDALCRLTTEDVNRILEAVPQVRSVLINTYGTADGDTLHAAGLSASQVMGTIAIALSSLPIAR